MIVQAASLTLHSHHRVMLEEHLPHTKAELTVAVDWWLWPLPFYMGRKTTRKPRRKGEVAASNTAFVGTPVAADL